MTRAGRAGWAVAAALGLAWALRRRGDCEIWTGHAHVHSGLSLARAWELCSRAWDTGGGGQLRIVWRMDGRELASVGAGEYAAARAGAAYNKVGDVQARLAGVSALLSGMAEDDAEELARGLYDPAECDQLARLFSARAGELRRAAAGG